MLFFFLDSKKYTRMLYCLCTYRIVGDNVYDLVKLVPYGGILVLRYSFCRTSFGCLHPNGKGSHLENKSSSFSGINFFKQLLVLIFTLKELSLIRSYLDKVSSKSSTKVKLCHGLCVCSKMWCITKQMKGWMLMIQAFNPEIVLFRNNVTKSFKRRTKKSQIFKNYMYNH